MSFIDETGNVYGLLTVIERAENSKGGAVKWKCKCECGNEVIVFASNLRKGNTRSCDCLRKINPVNRVDLTGNRYDRLLVLGEPQTGSRGTIWKCQCDCGTICYKVSADLVHHRVHSCGCYKRDLHSTMNNLTDQKFGELTALYTDEVANDGQRVWTCKCSCDSMVKVRAGALRSGKTQSCGCKTSKGNLKIKNYLDEQKILYIAEYSFPDLYRFSSRNPLKFDFAFLREEKVIGLLEYNGLQHYQPVDFFGGEKNFLDQQDRDKRKQNYCKNNNIPLFIIKYDEDIKERLEEIINELYFK